MANILKVISNICMVFIINASKSAPVIKCNITICITTKACSTQINIGSPSIINYTMIYDGQSTNFWYFVVTLQYHNIGTNLLIRLQSRLCQNTHTCSTAPAIAGNYDASHALVCSQVQQSRWF